MLWAIKPHLWHRFEFFSFGGQGSGGLFVVQQQPFNGNTRPPDLPLEKPVCSQEATVRTGHGTTDWLQIGKGVYQNCILSPCLLFNSHEKYIMWNARLDESQARIKTGGENINNNRYADDTTLTAESKEELKSLLMRVKEDNEKAGLSKTKCLKN